MKRNLNIKVTAPRSDTPLLDEKKKAQVYADYIVQSLDLYVGKQGGPDSRAIGELSDRIHKAKSPPKDVDLSTSEVEIICGALENMAYPNFVKRQITGYIEAK